MPFKSAAIKIFRKFNKNPIKLFQVPYSTGQSLAKTIGVAHFAECSALNGKNVSKIFKIAAAAALGFDKKSCCIL